METREITNCGLIALQGIMGIKSITARSLINIAEDNGLKLYPYFLIKNEFEKVSLPAIFHCKDHFMLISDKDAIIQNSELFTGYVLLKEKCEFNDNIDTKNIRGASWVAAGISIASAGYQIYQGIDQKNKASDLKKSNYVPPQLLMNRDLAAQQAFSRRAPGAALAEEQNRRLAANQISGAQRMFGGDANKIAAVSAGAVAGTQDANARIAAQGQQFSENAFGRLANANNALAGQDRANQQEYLQTKNALDNAGNTNIFNGVSNAGSSVITGMGAKQSGNSFAGQRDGIPVSGSNQLTKSSASDGLTNSEIDYSRLPSNQKALVTPALRTGLQVNQKTYRGNNSNIPAKVRRQKVAFSGDISKGMGQNSFGRTKVF